MQNIDKTLCVRSVLPGEAAERRIYAERLSPPQRLIIFGAGKDAQPLVNFSAQMGWRVVVADGRTQMARAERFPLAELVVALPQTGDALGPLKLASQDAVVVMTHSYEQDRRLLQAILRSAPDSGGAPGHFVPRYVGLLGARHRSRLLVRDCAEALEQTMEDCMAQLHFPVGLDLGSDEPESIALAIVAEIEATLHGRTAGMRSRESAAEMQVEIGMARQAVLCRPHFEPHLGPHLGED